jgi:hypothetical protein
VVSEGAETHEWWSLARKPPRLQGEGVSWPKTVTSFIFILCHKNYWKTTFNSGIPHAKFAMTLCWHSYDITSTCTTIRTTSLRFRDDTWRNRGNRIPHIVSDIFISPPDTTARSLDSTGQIHNILRLWWCTLSDKLCTEGNISVRILNHDKQ